MAVYVDDMRARVGRLVMCHMIADRSVELHAMARHIGVARRHCQHPGTSREHYDVSEGARARAVAAGAVSITRRELAQKVRARERVEQISMFDVTGSRSSERPRP